MSIESLLVLAGIGGLIYFYVDVSPLVGEVIDHNYHNTLQHKASTVITNEPLLPYIPVDDHISLYNLEERHYYLRSARGHNATREWKAPC